MPAIPKRTLHFRLTRTPGLLTSRPLLNLLRRRGCLPFYSTVYQVIYSSAAVVQFSDNDLASLLMRARAKNARLGVSGLLLYHEGSFLQVLEGAEDVLRSLFASISGDKRHNRIANLLSREVEARHFAQWEMGFVSMGELAKTLPGYSDYLRLRAEPAAAGDAAARVLSAFREGRFRSHVASGALLA